MVSLNEKKKLQNNLKYNRLRNKSFKKIKRVQLIILLMKQLKLLSKCQSKVILCGVGKSFRIASKISSTMASTGTPSFALSAGDCSHGDLGSITKKDVLIPASFGRNSRTKKYYSICK